MPIEKAIQFLVCPQRDFIGHVDGVQPNALHVGPAAVRKLRGAPGSGGDPFVETALTFFDPSVPGTERVEIVIDEDWHPANCPEFEIYGRHCVKGTDGARLVGELDRRRWEDKVHVLRANSINLASHPRYGQVLERVRGTIRPERMRVGVFGVWTNIKIEYLLVNLLTMPPAFPATSIGVCEPLCAAPDETWHAAAIDKFRLMGFQVFDRIDDYLRWMGLGV